MNRRHIKASKGRTHNPTRAPIPLPRSRIKSSITCHEISLERVFPPTRVAKICLLRFFVKKLVKRSGNADLARLPSLNPIAFDVYTMFKRNVMARNTNKE